MSDDTEQLLMMTNGFMLSQALSAAVQLGLPDRLGDAVHDPDDLAATVGADAATLRRLVRVLVGAQVLLEEPDGRVRLSALGAQLRTDTPGSLAGWVAWISTPAYWSAWAELVNSVRTGGTAFQALHGADVWTYRAAHPEVSAAFDRAMVSLSARVLPGVVAVVEPVRFARIADVGGGRGGLLAALLEAGPGTHGVLFDQPHVVADPVEGLRSHIASGRCEVAGGSFFQRVPPGCDAYVLKSVLHDWDDGRCGELLRCCRAAAAEGAALLVVERDLAAGGLEAALSDLNMLVGPGGRERTRAHYEALLAPAGWRLERILPTATGHAVFEAQAV